jgi:hypothetical protein
MESDPTRSADVATSSPNAIPRPALHAIDRRRSVAPSPAESSSLRPLGYLHPPAGHRGRAEHDKTSRDRPTRHHSRSAARQPHTPKGWRIVAQHTTSTTPAAGRPLDLDTQADPRLRTGHRPARPLLTARTKTGHPERNRPGRTAATSPAPSPIAFSQLRTELTAMRDPGTCASTSHAVKAG